MEHTPVLLNECLQAMQETSRPVNHYFDGTFGRGGHTRAVMKKFNGVKVVAFDRDLDAIEYANKNFSEDIRDGHLRIFNKSFSEFAEVQKAEKLPQFDIMLLDLGVSSPQLDQAERGFSFYEDGPLDMRMNQTESVTAAEIVNSWAEEDLNSLFQELGEIHRPQRVSRAIVNDRKEKPFTRTRELSSLIERVDGWRQKGRHPATQYFMALRLQVNRELEQVSEGLRDLVDGLEHGGRLLVITFHSLEDRIVKRSFLGMEDKGKPVFKKVIKPSREEEISNPRARSAKLRVFERS